MRTALHPQVGWQATLRALEDTQTLVASWLLEQDIRRASDIDLVLLDGSLSRLDLAKDQVGEGTALTKDGGWILGGQEEHHPVCFLFASYLRKLFGDDTQQQPVRVLVERHKMYR